MPYVCHMYANEHMYLPLDNIAINDVRVMNVYIRSRKTLTYSFLAKTVAINT